MATWILALIIVGAVYLAGKYILKTHQNGGCVGCSDGANGCCHCTQMGTPKVRKKPPCCQGKSSD